LDAMQGIEKIGQKQYARYNVNDKPELWDLSVLVNIFHDHFESVFCKNCMPSFSSEQDFPPKAKAMLLTVKDIRNKRAHDGPISAREAYRFTDTV